MKKLLFGVIALLVFSSISYAGIGIYRQGSWYIDNNDDGVWNPAIDITRPNFGGSTDIPVFVPTARHFSCPAPYWPVNNISICPVTADRILNPYQYKTTDCFNNVGDYFIDDWGNINFCWKDFKVKMQQWMILHDKQ